MGTVPPVVTLGLLLMAVAAAAQPQPSLGWLQGPPPPVQPEAETNRVISKGLEAVGERYQGAPAYYNEGIYGDVIGVFFGLLATGSHARARELRDGVCAAWRAMPRDGPFTGLGGRGGRRPRQDVRPGTVSPAAWLDGTAPWRPVQRPGRASRALAVSRGSAARAGLAEPGHSVAGVARANVEAAPGAQSTARGSPAS